MNTSVTMLERTVDVQISKAAEKHLAMRDTPLNLEMELYFSCLLRKRVLVRDSIQSDYSARVSDKLNIGFRPVMTKACSIADTDDDGKPQLTDFPIEKPDRYIPHWLQVDFKRGQWVAEFGYADDG